MASSTSLISEDVPITRAPKQPAKPHVTSTGEEFFFIADSNGYYADYTVTKTGVVNKAPRPLYKVLTANGEAPIAGNHQQYSLPTHNADGTWTPGEWMPTLTGALKVCLRGYHSFDGDHWADWMQTGHRLFEVEYDGPVQKAQQKWLGARVRLLREIPLTSERATTALMRRRTKADYVEAATRETRTRLMGEFTELRNEKVLAKFVKKHPDWADRVREALKNNRSLEVQFASDTLADAIRMTREADRLLGTTTNTGAIEARLAEVKQVGADLPKMKRSHMDTPWAASMISGADLLEIGVEQYTKYQKRALKELAEAEKKAEAEYASATQPANFDELVASLDTPKTEDAPSA